MLHETRKILGLPGLRLVAPAFGFRCSGPLRIGEHRLHRALPLERRARPWRRGASS